MEARRHGGGQDVRCRSDYSAVTESYHWSMMPQVPPPKRHPYDQWSPDARALDLVGGNEPEADLPAVGRFFLLGATYKF